MLYNGKGVIVLRVIELLTWHTTRHFQLEHLRAQYSTILVYGSDHLHLVLELGLDLGLDLGIARIVQAYQVGVASTRVYRD